MAEDLHSFWSSYADDVAICVLRFWKIDVLDGQMAVNGDLKLKRPLEEDHCSGYEEGYKKARMETQRDYRAMLMLMTDQIDAIDVYHEVELDVHSLYAKLELLNYFTREAELKSEKEKFESELRLVEAKLEDLKVPVIDWYKLGEPSMYR
ncbi:hypothetical protein Bca4012_019116 [Brassica carinata]